MPRRAPNHRGFTFLETMITGFLFIFFLLQLGNIWQAYDKWYQYLQDRLEVDQEARVARQFLVADFARTEDAVLHPPLCALSLDDTQAERSATYEFVAPWLIRHGQAPTRVFPVAGRVSQVNFGLDSYRVLTSQVSLSKRDHDAELTVYVAQSAE